MLVTTFNAEITMKHMHTVTEPAKQVTLLQRITCDLCGAETKDADVWPLTDGEEVLGGHYHTRSAVVQLEESAGFGQDGGESRIVSVDVCPACFKGKLLPLLESMGAKPSHSELDW